MKMIILVIPLLITLHSEGQIINASQPYRPFAVASSYSYLLDDYTNGFYNFSFFKLRSAYSGYCVRVRRSDNTEQDIGFGGNLIDTAALKSFTGSNSAYVVTAYDQSGNGYNLTQGTASRQPRIVNAGVIERKDGEIAMYFNSANGTGLGLTFTSVATTAHSLFVVFTPAGGDSYSRVVSFRGDVIDYLVYAPALSNAGTLTTFGGYASSSFRAGITVSSSSLNIYAAIHTGAEIKNSNNGGTEQTFSHSLSSTIRRYTIGCSAFADDTFDDGNITGYVSEVLSWNSDQTANKSAILNNINSRLTVY